jgi:hypothetical protein
VKTELVMSEPPVIAMLANESLEVLHSLESGILPSEKALLTD